MPYLTEFPESLALSEYNMVEAGRSVSKSVEFSCEYVIEISKYCN